MEHKNINRRKSLEKILEIAALAGGISLVEFKKLVARSSGDLDKLKDVKTLYKEAKILKQLLIPRPEIFKSEFGRKPMQNIFLDKAEGIIHCTVNEDLLQGVYSNDCPNLQSCGQNFCGGQGCPNLDDCEDNVCTGQSRIEGFESNLVDPTDQGILNKINTDPFVQALYKELNVKNANSLQSTLENQIEENLKTKNLTKTDPRLGACAKVKASSPEAKMLKVLLLPTAQNFYDAFGRMPQDYMVFVPDPGFGHCVAHMNSIGDLIVINQGSCDDNVCKGQTCSSLTSCGSNECSDQNCTGLERCDKNYPPLTMESLDQLRDDPFVSALYQEFNTTSSSALANQLHTVLHGTSQLMQPAIQMQTRPQLQQKQLKR